MKLKTSFFNQTLIKEDLKRFWGMGLLYFLLLLFAGPLYIFIVNIEHPDRVYYTIENFINIQHNGLEIICTIAIPIILGVLIFRYLQLKNSSGMLHALPFTRNILLNSHILSGIIILLIPVLLNFIIMLITYSNLCKNINTTIAISDIYHWFFITLLLNYTTFFITIFTGMISGVSFIQGILSLIFLFLPLGFTGLFMLFLDKLLFGFVPNYFILENFAVNIMPITHIFDHSEISHLLMLWYIILLVGLFFASKVLYHKRNLENATDTIVFNILKPLFKYSVTFCTMILGGLYFSKITNNTQSWLYFGFFIGALFGYIIAEMILQKSIWIFHRLFGFVPFIIIMILLIGAIELDLTGYEKRLPDIKNIEGAYFDHHTNTFKEDDHLFHEKENLINIQNFHQMIINNQKTIENSIKTRDERTTSVAIGYKYKNGNTLIREYSIPYAMKYKNPYIKKIYESKEYKIINNKIFSTDVNNIDCIYIEAYNVDRQITIFNQNEIKEFVDILKEDIINQTYEEMNSNQAKWAEIRIVYPKNLEKASYKQKDDFKTIYLDLKKSYNGLEKWLKQKGYYKNVRILPKDIEYAVVTKIKDSTNPDIIYKEISKFDPTHIKELKDKAIVIKDENNIEKLLKSYNMSSLKDRKYCVIFYLKNRNTIIGWYSQKNALDFIKASF
ncbi:hypothetical protein [Crassaminicella indica]|uniref:ABC-2 type transport system permease protein n=1 Tax=Crassaminicella indica TaxID=2855394 RepID=A0ABX8RA35_9CLOT|nr:hypothetical protein [Crassaminicella indica]QXM05666.1 hypothetical protein KVH43_09830 [Crassaminicella indica]